MKCECSRYVYRHLSVRHALSRRLQTSGVKMGMIASPDVCHLKDEDCECTAEMIVWLCAVASHLALQQYDAQLRKLGTSAFGSSSQASDGRRCLRLSVALGLCLRHLALSPFFSLLPGFLPTLSLFPFV